MVKRLHTYGLIMLLAGIFFPFASQAAHIVGGEMYYDHLGGSQYRVYIVLYRDCNSGGAEFDPELSLGVYNSSGGLIENRLIPFPGKQNLPVVFNNPCVNQPSGICTEQAVYQDVLTLPPINGGYNLVYQRCCRGPSITNLQNPDDAGLTLMTHIPGSNTGAAANSSARFTNYPPLVICNNDELIFNHAANDPDGDSLVYSLATPKTGGTSAAPAPNPPTPPPHANVQWLANHSATQPLGPGSVTQIDPQTGVLVCDPGAVGKYVVGVMIKEYRNGVLITSTIRDFLFVVISCDIELQAILPLQTELQTFNGFCNGLTVDFENNSYGGTTYAWDFGDPNTTADVSSAFEPSYTYAQSGEYLVRLIIDPGSFCTDTAYMEVKVRPGEIKMNLDANDSVCFIQHSIDFLLSSNADSTVSYDWDFGPNASQQFFSGQGVDSIYGITYTGAGSFPLNIHAEDGECEGDTVINIIIFDYPVADFDLPVDYPCGGQTVSFENQSTNSFVFDWDFGEAGASSTEENPTFTYNNPGVFTIQLIAGSTGTCFDTIQKDFKIYKDLIMEIENNDSLCIVDNQFYFNGIVSGPDSTTLTWDFGPYATPSTSNDTLNPNVSFSIPGNHTIYLSGEYLMCKQTVQTQIFIYKTPEIGFDIAPGKQCQPFYAQFVNLSDADTEIFYEWDFGNGQTSNLPAPTTTYVDTGVFEVFLRIYTTDGCIDTLVLTRDDLVDVKPKPTAAFSMSAKEIDICPGEITFYDESVGASKYSFNPDDDGRIATDVPAVFNYIYSTSGNKNVIQVVENIYGCADTSIQQLSVYPYSVYVPNAFTPNDDKFNNEHLTITSQPAYEWHMQIFNRYGEKIFESFDQNEEWDGTHQGEPVPDGLYSYVIDLLACGRENPNRSFTGTIAVLR